MVPKLNTQVVSSYVLEVYGLSIFIIIYCNFSLKIKVFSIATIVFFNNSLPTYYNYNNIFLNV
jgi:hypothetical protein